MRTEVLDEPARWELARGGDPASFAAIFDAHRDRVFGQALRLVRSPHDAEDITAVVFLEAWRRRNSVRVVNDSILAWLLVTTNNVAHNAARSRGRYRAAIDRLPRSLDEEDQFDAADDRLDRAERDRELRDAFARLSTKDQNIITLCVIEELSTAEAAAALGVPLGTVKSRLSRAKERLSAFTAQALTDNTIASGGAK